MYVITGASGNTGKLIANALLDAGKKVRVLGRDAEKVKDLTDKGAEAAIGNLDDVDFLTNAMTGATAIYAMIPPNFVSDNYRGYQNQVADAQIEAAKNAGHLFEDAKRTEQNTTPTSVEDFSRVFAHVYNL